MDPHNKDEQNTTPQMAPIPPNSQTIIERQVIWSGSLEWHEKQKGMLCNWPGPLEGQKIQVPCQVSATVAAGEPEVKGDGWPQKLIMQLIPKAFVGSLGGTYFRDVKTVLFMLQNCDALTSLTRVLDSGFAGCVHFTGAGMQSSCTIKVLLLLYSKERHAYLGFIPKDQTGFVDRIRIVIQSHKNLQAVMRQGLLSFMPNNNNSISVASSQQQKQPNPIGVISVGGQTLAQQLPGQQPGNTVLSPQLTQNQQQAHAQQQQQAISKSNDSTSQQDHYEIERQQNLLKIQQLQQTLQQAQQRELEYQQLRTNVQGPGQGSAAGRPPPNNEMGPAAAQYPRQTTQQVVDVPGDGSVKPQMIPPAPNSQTEERQVIWSGLLEWHEKQKGPLEGQKIPRQVPCQVSAAITAGEAEVKGDGWPQNLIMQLIPKAVVRSLGGTYFLDVTKVLFMLQNCDALTSLTRVFDSGFAGCLHFPGSGMLSSCSIKVLILLYNKEKHEYFGFIPTDQTGFVDRIRKVIQQQAVMRQGILPTDPKNMPDATPTRQQQEVQGMCQQQQKTNPIRMLLCSSSQQNSGQTSFQQLPQQQSSQRNSSQSRYSLLPRLESSAVSGQDNSAVEIPPNSVEILLPINYTVEEYADLILSPRYISQSFKFVDGLWQPVFYHRKE